MLNLYKRARAAVRLKKADAAFKAAYEANLKATERQDTRTMNATRSTVCAARREQLAAEIALDLLTPKRKGLTA